MNKFLNNFYKVIIAMMVITWGIITFSSCFHIYGKEFNPVILIIASIIVFTLIYNFYKFADKRTERNHDKIAIAMAVISFSFMLIWGIKLEIIPAYDLSHIIAKSDSMLLNNHIFGSDLYFSIYPTQIPITLLVYALKSVGVLLGLSNPSWMMIFFNAFMTSLMFLFIYKIGKKLTNSRLGLTMMFLACLYPDFYLFTPYYYTDIVSLPFGIIGLYFLLKSEEERAPLYLILSGILFGIGFKLRVTILIILIAYLVSLFRKYCIKEIVKRSILIILGIIITIIGYNKLIYPCFKVELDSSVKAPITHWIMMGTNPETDGGYTDADINMTINSHDKVGDNIQTIKRRLTKITPSFIYNKIRKVWSEGNHDIQRKYALTTEYTDWRGLVRGELSGVGRYYAQIMKIVIYLFFLIMLIKEYKNCNFSKSNNAIFAICLFGAIIFYLLWEALNRYSFSFLPMIILGTSPGITSLIEFIDRKKIGKYDMRDLKRKAGIVIIIILILSIILSVIYYSTHRVNVETERNAQIYSTRRYTPLYDNELKQVFRVKGDFNRLQLKGMFDKVTKPLEYHYELYKYDGTLLEDGIIKFMPNPEKVVGKIQFKFKSIHVDKPTEFYLKFYSLEATEDNYIAINSYELTQKLRDSSEYSPEFYGSNYDINPNAETYFNGVLSKGNAYLRVFEKRKKNILDNKIFIIMSIFVILIMLSSLYMCLLKRRNE